MKRRTEIDARDGRPLSPNGQDPKEPLAGEVEDILIADAERAEDLPVGGDPLMPPGASEVAPPPIKLQSMGKSTLLLAAANAASMAVSFVMLPLYTRYLSTADYGAIELVELSLDLLTIIAGSRLLGGVLRFYFKATSDDERRAVVSTAIWTVGLGFALIGMLAVVAAPLIAHTVLGADRYTGLVRLGGLSIATSAPTFVPNPYFQARGRFRLIVGAQLGRLAIQVTLNALLLTVAHLGARSMFISTIVANVTLGSLLVFLTLRDVGVRYAPKVAADLYRFGFPLVLTQVATFILTFGDRYFLREVATLGGVGLYSLSYKFAFALQSLAYTPYSMVWDPKRHEVAKRADRDGIYARMFIYMNVGYLTTGVAIAVFVRIVLQILTPESYWKAADVVPVLLAAMVLQTWSSTQDIGIIISERTKWVAVANWAAAAAVLISYALLIPHFAAWGAAIATVIGYAVRYVGIYTKSQQLWPVRYNWAPVRRLLALAICVVIIGAILPSGPLALAIVLRVCLFALYAVLVWRLPILTEADRAAARRNAARLLDLAAGFLRGTEPESAAR